jgi:predicted ATP-grasp superfamily ATP-dependent carboligase
MKPIVMLDCDDFSARIRVSNGKPNSSLQLFSSMNSKISILASDFAIPNTHEKQLARGLVAWAKKQTVALIITMSAAPSGRGDLESLRTPSQDFLAAYSTESARQRIIQSKTDFIENGSIDGLSAALLIEGLWSNLDVIALQISTSERSSSEVAARTVQAIDLIIPEVKFDTTNFTITESLPLGLSKGPAASAEK